MLLMRNVKAHVRVVNVFNPLYRIESDTNLYECPAGKEISSSTECQNAWDWIRGLVGGNAHTIGTANLGFTRGCRVGKSYNYLHFDSQGANPPFSNSEACGGTNYYCLCKF